MLVAVDDSAAAVTIARYGAALATGEHRQLLVLTVIPSATGHPGIAARAGDDADLLTMECVHSDGVALLTRLARTPATRAVDPHLLVAGYRARGGSRRVARRVATTILAVARNYRAAVIVIGLPDQPRPRAQSVSGRVAYGAPAGTRVLFTAAASTPDGPVAGGDGRPAAAMLAAATTLAALSDPVGPPPLPPPSATTLLTPAGRRELTRQYLRLRSQVLPRVQDVLRASTALSAAQRHRLAVVYQTTIERRRHLTRLLVDSARTERLPADPTTVEIGDLVTIDADGAAITLLLVDPVEAAFLHQAWLLPDGAPGGHRPVEVLPADSALGAALFGRRVGEEVTVPAARPGRQQGTVRVFSCRRLRPTDLAAAAPRRRRRQTQKGDHPGPGADAGRALLFSSVPSETSR